jgi:Ni2+-binding GTPase involved in maturation of urease and hydrogenase
LAREALREGKTLRVVGGHQSGRSTLIAQLSEDLEATGVEVIAVRGDFLSQVQDGRVLEEFRASLGLHRKHRGLGDSIDEICKTIAAGSGLVVDDAHLADRISLRAIHEIRRRLSLRVVIGELPGRRREEDLPSIWPEKLIPLSRSTSPILGLLCEKS